MQDYSFCSDDFSTQPYWWDRTARPETAPQSVPESIDVLVIGAGYTGLHCALQTAAAGRQTLVIDADAIGSGCSTRNGGQIGGELKTGLDQLERKMGQRPARALVQEGRYALRWLQEFIADNDIDCDLSNCGRFIAAHSQRQFENLRQRLSQQLRGLELDMKLVEASDQRSEIDSDYYHGGLLIAEHCSLDPARYHQGLVQMSQNRGIELMGHCRALDIDRNKQGFRIQTSQGSIQARQLVMATNGYTPAAASWLQRRIIPIGSYMLATEPLSQELADRLMPRQRVFSDTRKIVVYFRRSPDGRRLIFGGRVSVFESDPVKCLPALRAEMLRVFPQLEQTRISHSWMGFVGYSFDNLPHIGVEDGIHYAMGYCGSGISLASYLGSRLGLQLVGDVQGETLFSKQRFQTRPLYRGKPWFLSAAVRYYQLLDRLS